MTNNRCEHMLVDGSQCGSWAMEGATKCFSHNEATQKRKAIAVRKGGATRKAIVWAPLQKITVNTPADIVKLLSQTINEVRDGTLDPRIANTIAYITGHLIKAYDIAKTDHSVPQYRPYPFESKDSDVKVIDIMEPKDREDFLKLCERYGREPE